MRDAGYALVPGLTGTNSQVAAKSGEHTETVFFNTGDKIRGIEMTNVSYYELFDAEKVESMLWDVKETLMEDEICVNARLIDGCNVIFKINNCGDVIKLSGPEVCKMPEVCCIFDIPIHLCKRFMEGLFSILEIK